MSGAQSTWWHLEHDLSLHPKTKKDNANESFGTLARNCEAFPSHFDAKAQHNTGHNTIPILKSLAFSRFVMLTLSTITFTLA